MYATDRRQTRIIA